MTSDDMATCDTWGKKRNVDIKDMMQEVHCGYPKAKRIMGEKLYI